MKTKLARQKAIESGDYTSRLERKGGRMVDKRKKQLINLPDDQKAWIMRVVQLAIDKGQDCNQTVVIRALVGSAMQEEPESFVARLEELAKKARLAEIDRRFAALEAEKAKLVGSNNDRAMAETSRS